MDSGVNLRLLMTYGHPERLIDKALTASHWGYLVESLWDSLGVEMDESTLRRLYHDAHLDFMKIMKRFDVVIGLLIGIMLIYWIFNSEFSFWAFFFLLIGVFGISYPLYGYYKNIKKKRELFPDR
jgi:hypothetical protein